jgi:hypothetical protein
MVLDFYFIHYRSFKMVKKSLTTIALLILIVGCGVGENLSEEKVKSSLEGCINSEHYQLKSVGPIIMADKNKADVTFKFESNISTPKYISDGSATYQLDSKGDWYMTNISAVYIDGVRHCKELIPIIAK